MFSQSTNNNFYQKKRRRCLFETANLADIVKPMINIIAHTCKLMLQYPKKNKNTKDSECLKQGGLQMGKSGIEPHLKVQVANRLSYKDSSECMKVLMNEFMEYILPD